MGWGLRTARGVMNGGRGGVGRSDGPDGEGGGRHCGAEVVVVVVGGGAEQSRGSQAEQPSRLVTAGEEGEDASALRLAETVVAVGSEAREHEPSALRRQHALKAADV